MKQQKAHTKQASYTINNMYLSMLSTCIILFVVLILTAFTITYQRILTSNIDIMETTAQLYADDLCSKLQTTETQLSKLTQDETLARFITGTGTAEQQAADKQEIEWQTTMLREALPVLEYIAYYNVNGDEILINSENENQELFSSIVSWMYLNTLSSNTTLFLSLPDGDTYTPFFIISVQQNNIPAGYIVAKVSHDYLNSFCMHYTAAQSSNIYLLDKYLNLLHGDITAADWEDTLVAQNRIREEIMPPIEETTARIQLQLQDEPMRSAVSVINRDYNIIVLVSIHQEEITKQAAASLNLIIFTTLCMMAGTAAVNILLYKRLDTPLKKMVKCCDLIKNGAIDVRFDHYPDKNLNILSDTLNETVESLAAYQKNLETMAFTDSLLGIGNRSACIRQIEQLIKSEKHDFSLFMVDVVDFDHFNELFSVKIGDMLLRKAAAMLDTVSNSKVFRYNGDTFIIIITGADGAKCASVIREIKDFFTNPIQLPTGKYTIGMDAGRADYPDHGTTVTELLRCCKTALKYTKTLSARNLCIVYNSIINDAIVRRIRIKDIIIDAIYNTSNVEVVYQPVYSVKDRRFTRLEALLRIKCSEFAIQPEEAIEIAEENGLINDLGDIVIRNVCAFARHLQDRKTGISTISINLSVVQLLQHGFFDRLKKMLTNSQIPLSFFEFEITETVLITSFDSIREKLQQLKALGIRLALDDFGSGYSGINYLANLPVDTLKLDRHIVFKLGASHKHDVLVKSIIDACKNFNLDIVAEGVESREVLEKAIELGADYIQGFFYAFPISQSRVFSFLEESRIIANPEKH